jgi:hypothetical protein
VAPRRAGWHVRPVRGATGRDDERSRSVFECVAAPTHAGSLAGARRVGEARGEGGRIVRVGLFADGTVRFRATSCASLIAYAEVACEALEAGVAAAALDAPALRARVAGVHPSHLERAALVAAAVRAAYEQPEDP